MCLWLQMAVPAWRLALLERKKKQEEDEKVKKAQEEEAKLASLPAWKRAILLREKQGKAEPPAATKQQLNSTSQKSPAKLPGKLSNKWQVAVERVKGPDSPVLKQKFTHPAPSNPAPSTSPAPSSPKLPPAVTTTLASPKQVTRNQVVNRWKHAAPKEPASPKITPVVRNNFKPAALSTPAPQAKQDEEDSSLAGLPAWKKALILKRRQAQQPPVAVNSSQPPAATNNSQPPAPTNSSSETNTVSGHREEATVNGAKSTTVKTVSKHSQSLQPEVVNRKDVTASTETANQRLVEQEGITLHPPVYKEVDEWANVKEDDDKFKDLPLWKQALIKRRRADIAKRSGLPVTVTPTLPPAATPSSTSASRTQAPDSPTTKKERKTHWKQAQNKTSANTRPSVTEQKKSSGVLSSRVSNHYTSSKASSTTKSTKSNRSEDLKPARKAPAPPPAKNKEEMFTYNFSKSSRRTLDTGGSSSDSTDSDLEDAIITNLDESSDEDDSGIVLQKYTKSSEQSPNLGKKSHSDTSVVSKSALSTPGKKKKVRVVFQLHKKFYMHEYVLAAHA